MLFTTTKPVTIPSNPPFVADQAFIGVFFQPVVKDGKVASTVRFSAQTGFVDESGSFHAQGAPRFLAFGATDLAKFRESNPTLDRAFTTLETSLAQLAPELEAKGL